MAKKILLVDDSTTQRLASRRVFGNIKDYELISACDGKEGLEMALRERPDMILMDLEMPRMSGIEVCKALKCHEQMKKVPVILLTMRGEKHFVQEAFSSGCADYLVKPLNEEKLLAVLRKHLKD